MANNSLQHKARRVSDLEHTLEEYLSKEEALQEELTLTRELSETAALERDRYVSVRLGWWLAWCMRCELSACGCARCESRQYVSM